MDGYIIERCGVSWNKRFWIDMPSVGVKGFGEDKRARIFFTKKEAEDTLREIDQEFGCHCFVTKLSDLYPSFTEGM